VAARGASGGDIWGTMRGGGAEGRGRAVRQVSAAGADTRGAGGGGRGGGGRGERRVR
jgi:hypothetical protein